MTRLQGRPWWVLAIACAATFMTVLDLWVVTSAYPALERAFAPTTLSELSWILNVYAILLAAFLIPAGRLADDLGRRRCFLAGLALFGIASLGCALAPTLSVLIAMRALKALAAAILMPTSLGFVLSAFPRRRSMALGVWAATGAAAASSGPVVGGLLAVSSWRWIFSINVPIVAVALALGALCLPASEARARRRIDGAGALLIALAMGLVCTALVEARAWSPWRTGPVLGAGVILALVFVVHVRRHPAPIVSPSLFGARRFRSGALALFAYYVGFSAMLLGSTLLLTDAWSFSTFHAALALVPGPAAASLVSPFTGGVTRRIGFRKVVIGGALFFAMAGAWPLIAARASPSYVGVLLPSFVLWGVANGLLQPTLFATADAAPGAELASASAVLTMARQLGSAFGIAVLVFVLAADHAADLDGLRRVWAVVIATAALTAVAGLRAQPVSA